MLLYHHDGGSMLALRQCATQYLWDNIEQSVALAMFIISVQRYLEWPLVKVPGPLNTR